MIAAVRHKVVILLLCVHIDGNQLDVGILFAEIDSRALDADLLVIQQDEIHHLQQRLIGLELINLQLAHGQAVAHRLQLLDAVDIHGLRLHRMVHEQHQLLMRRGALCVQIGKDGDVVDLHKNLFFAGQRFDAHGVNQVHPRDIAGTV